MAKDDDDTAVVAQPKLTSATATSFSLHCPQLLHIRPGFPEANLSDL